MSDITFQDYIEQNKLQYTDKNNIEEQDNQRDYLMNVTETLSVASSDFYNRKGFTEKQVAEAAKFILKADQYGLEPKALEVKDSPIYYYKDTNGKKCSRGYFERKRLQKAGRNLIKFAKKRNTKLADYLINDKLTRIDEKTWQRKEPEPEHPTMADTLVDKFVSSGTMDITDRVVRNERQDINDDENVIQKSITEAMSESNMPDLTSINRYSI